MIRHFNWKNVCGAGFFHCFYCDIGVYDSFVAYDLPAGDCGTDTVDQQNAAEDG